MLAVCEALRLLFSSMVSEHCIRFRELWKTTRRAESSSQVGKSPVYEDVPKIEVFVPSLILCESNHRHWSMKMEVHTEAQALWEVAHGTNVNLNKDRRALSIKRKENKEILPSVNCGS